MSRPTVTICTRCDEGKSGDGDRLYERIRKLRKELDLKEVFELDEVQCLGLCDSPCNVMFEGKKRSTYVRTNLHAKRDAEAVVKAACAYAELEPGQELPERLLPGEPD
jgi:predicted metal-binding protein